MKLLDVTVFPSKEKTITVDEQFDKGVGAHRYQFQNSLGFNSEKKIAESDNSFQTIQFVKKEEDGTMTPGLQSEQLVIALIDRHKKLNAQYPSSGYNKMITGLEMFLEACKERVQDRIDRGVMGDLKK